MEPCLTFLALLLLANGAPWVATLILGRAGARPLDGGRRWRDGRPLFGSAKTWRGLLASLVLTPPAAWVLGLGWGTGVLIALGAMAGDLLVSFIKRRLGLPSSTAVAFLDQVPETLIPAVLVGPRLDLGWPDLAGAVLAFALLDLGLTPLLKRLAAALDGRRRAAVGRADGEHRG